MSAKILVRGKYIVSKPEDVNVKEWSKDLAEFINNILRPIIRDNRKRKQYISQKAMRVWESAFTHPGFDETQGKNYEELEFIGDRALKYAFNKYTMSRFPEYDKRMLSDMETTYMSKDYQPKFGKKMGLDKYARILHKDARKAKVLEDLFESFMGALDVVSDDIEAGLGIINVRNFVAWFFNKESLEMTAETLGGVVITRVRQIFERFDVRAVRDEKNRDIMNEWSEGDDGIKTLRVKITPGIREILRDKFKINFRGNYLGQAKGRDKEEVTIRAYRDALVNLEKYGINSESAKLLKELYDFAQPELLPYRLALARKLREDGYVRAYFTKPGKLRTDQSITIVMMAEDEAGDSHEIDKLDIAKSTIPGETLETETKARMIRNYVGIEEVEPVVKGKERLRIEKVEVEVEEVEEEEEVDEGSSRAVREGELNSFKVPVLKTILRDQGLRVGGRKADLVERILDNEFGE